MEYVDGTRIDQYCESRKSTITERLQLFRAVCGAVEYAHRSLVVHRDIKAGNILVTADGTPKLLDFGVAKLLRPEFVPHEATRIDQRPKTLDYASPEQIRGEPVTTSTDVYSLGVLLYKLLTGTLPHPSGRRTVADVQNAICEEEPKRPSAVVLSDAKAAIPQATQKIEVSSEAPIESRDRARKRLKKKLTGDLDMIVLKALRKEPQRRYASVEQFSEDIRRHLERLPIGRDTEVAKFVRRGGGAGDRIGGIEAGRDRTGARQSAGGALRISAGLCSWPGNRRAGGANAGEETRLAVASANVQVGEVLMRNGARNEGAAKLKKAMGIYRELGKVDRVAAMEAELRRQ